MGDTLAMPKTGTDDNRGRLEEILSRRIMLLDGSMGALLYSYELNEEDYRGKRFARHPVNLKNCTEALVLSQPKIIEDIHRAYLDAGADIIETDTFNGTAVSLGEFSLQEYVGEINTTAVELAPPIGRRIHPEGPGQASVRRGQHRADHQAALDGDSRRGSGRRDVTFDQMVATYEEQIRALIEGGADILLPETSFDTLVLKACLFAIEKVFDETRTRLPVMISGTIFDNGRTLSGQPIEAFYYSVSHIDAMSVGINLRRGCRADAELDRGAVVDLPDASQLLSERRHARRLRGFPGRPRQDRGHARRIRQERMAQYHRRLLRYATRLDLGHRSRSGRGAATPGSRCPALVHLQWHGFAGDPSRD